MLKPFSTLILTVLLTGCATINKSDMAQSSDAATTALVITTEVGREANPIMAPLAHGGPVGLGMMLAIKLGMPRLAKAHLSFDNCRSVMAFSTGAGWIGTASGFAALAGLGPIGPFMGLPLAFAAMDHAKNNSAKVDCLSGKNMAHVLMPIGTDLSILPVETVKEARIVATIKNADGEHRVARMTVNDLEQFMEFADRQGWKVTLWNGNKI